MYGANNAQNGWKYLTRDNVTEIYDATGKLTSITDQAGRVQTLSYDGSGRLQRVTSNNGEFLIFTYDADNRIAMLTTHANQQWRYRYDTVGNLEYVDNPDGTARRYHYEDSRFPNALTGITDERGIRYSSYGYDAQGRANLSMHANNAQRVDVVYNADGTRTVTNSRGQSSSYGTQEQLGVALVTSMTGPGCSTCGNSNASYQYDTDNSITSKTQNGVTTQFGDYDSVGQYGYRIEAYGTPQQRRLDYTYDSRFHHKVASITETSVASGRQKVTTYTYDAYGNRTSETISGHQPNGTPVSRTTTYQYNGPLNQLSRIDGPRGDVSDVTTFDYHPYTPFPATFDPNNGRLLRITGPTGVLRDNLQYTATGKIASEMRPNGLRLDYAYYSGNDRLMTLTQTDTASGEARTTRFTYLASGEVESITQAHGTQDATTLSFGYDAARRLTRITDGLGNHIEYTLDTEGNRTEEKTYDPSGALKKRLTQTFDLYNRLDISTRENQRDDYTYAANGDLDTHKDGNNITTDYDYDALSRLVKTTQNAGGLNPATANTATQYGYDSQDRLTRVTDPNGNATVYAYDDLGNLLTQSSPDTGTTTFSYDAAGNLKTKQDASGNSFSYSFDAANRLTFLDAPGTADDVSYVYDACANGTGRICGVTMNGISASYRYDAFGHITRHQGIDYSYDSAGRLHTITYPSGAIVTYSYNAAGQVSEVQLTQGWTTRTLASNITHAPFGPVEDLTYGNGRSLNQPLDSAYRLTAISIPGVISVNGMDYDGNGNLTRRYFNSTAENFSYDALDRLDTASGLFGNRDYDHDKNGNRTRLVENSLATGYGYTSGSNRLASETAWSYTRDPNGNTTARLAADGQGWQYGYTRHNRLASATWRGQLKASYAYNGLGQRTSKTGASQTDYRYGTDGALLAELDASGNVMREYIHLNGQPLAMLQGGAVYYIHNDHLGTPQRMTDATGTVVWSAQYDPFGAASVNEDVDGNGQTVTLNLRFPGQYYDQETGLHYNYFRDYEPATGRYLTSDPIGLEGGLNTYLYAGGNSIRYIDPDGKVFCLPWLCEGGQNDPNKPGKPDKKEKPKRKSCAESTTNFAACTACCNIVSGAMASGGPSICHEQCMKKQGITQSDVKSKMCGI